MGKKQVKSRALENTSIEAANRRRKAHRVGSEDWPEMEAKISKGQGIINKEKQKVPKIWLWPI